MANRYSPPKSEVGDVTAEIEEFQPISLWSASGRIGRLRYLAYSTAATLITLAGAGILFAIVGPMLGGIALVLAYIPLIIFSVLTLIKRSHDMNWSGWTALIALFIPLAGLIWVFNPGTKGENDYGAPPPPNTTAVKVLGLLLPILVVVLGILAAIAIPAYQQYQQRAHAAQQSE